MIKEDKSLLDNLPDTKISDSDDETSHNYVFLAIVIVLLCFFGFFAVLYLAFF